MPVAFLMFVGAPTPPNDANQGAGTWNRSHESCLNIRQPEPFDDLRQEEADAVVQADVGEIDKT